MPDIQGSTPGVTQPVADRWGQPCSTPESFLDEDMKWGDF